MSKKYHHGGYHGTVISGGQVIQSGSGGIGPAGMGGASFSGDPTSYGDSTNNNQTGTNSQSGDANVTEVIPEIPGQIVSDEDKIWELATQAYLSNPGYAKSWEGKEYAKQLASNTYKDEQGNVISDPVVPGDPRYEKAMIQAFGMPNIVTTNYGGKPILTKKYTTEYGEEIPGGEHIFSGLGKSLMDQYDQPGSYEDKAETYWDDRAAAESAADQGQPSWGGYSGGGGGGVGGTGYYGDPRTGNPVEQMANFYTPQANLQQAMINVHGTPTVFAKRGGIVSLLRLN
jgi:hypothetical protein